LKSNVIWRVSSGFRGGSVWLFAAGWRGSVVFSLITFGGVRLLRPDATVVQVQTHRAQALLLFLALHRGKPVHRETICDALWPDTDPAAAKSQLRKALWRIKSAVGNDDKQPPIFCSEFQIGLDIARVTVDLWVFVDTMRSVELCNDEALTREDAERLLEALDLNCNAFGRGVFDNWVLVEQEALRDARILAMERLTAFHRVRGNLSQAICWAQRALKLDPLREHLHAAIIEFRLAMGDRALALRQYTSCEDILRREIGMTPSSLVRRLHRSLEDDV
jgi:DNA-binding SARP family transcriptional activator